MTGSLRKLANLSPAKLWGFIARPAMIPVLLAAPPNRGSIYAISRLFGGTSTDELERLRLEYLNQHELFAEVNRRMVARRRRHAHWREWYEFLYVLMRLARPEWMIETGVFDGQSSAVILQAMHENGHGHLISIDLPAVDTIAGSTDRMTETQLPPGCQPGWLVSDALRERYELQLGDARTLLPQLFAKHPRIDVFFHDSLHTYDHMLFEYRVSWDHIADGGFLISDDVFWNPAFHRFCRERGRPYVRVGGFGATRK